MDHNSIPYTLPGLKITRTIVTPTKLIIHAEATRREICCPDCRQPSVSKHSRYIRKVQDVPVGSQMVELHIRTRRFYCRTPDCSRRTFAEQHLGIVPRRGRR
ncbi:MAG: transposase family protein, partial [Candidatus Promineifilaceae bacterium]|nr:transposase family protein [Candidatus Promineifilaceae bacterium]